tara:strand:- start:265 stop:474 length:210 start_codon:yes stop_codon:yes gene_type:complete
MKKMSKKQKVLLYMQTYGSITQKDAIDLFNAYRLSAIIYDLKHKDGHDITTTLEGKSKHARYTLNVETE